VNSQFNEQDTLLITKTKQALRSKVAHALIEFPRHLQTLITKNCILTGGSISSEFHNEDANDYDLYFTNQQALDEFNQLIENDPEVKEYIVEVKDKYRGYIGKNGKLITENAVTFKNKIQVITRSLANDAREAFDYIHCMPYYNFQNSKMYLSRLQYNAILEKKLVINPKYANTEPPQFRFEKYKNRGWRYQ